MVATRHNHSIVVASQHCFAVLGDLGALFLAANQKNGQNLPFGIYHILNQSIKFFFVVGWEKLMLEVDGWFDLNCLDFLLQEISINSRKLVIPLHVIHEKKNIGRKCILPSMIGAVTTTHHIW